MEIGKVSLIFRSKGFEVEFGDLLAKRLCSYGNGEVRVALLAVSRKVFDYCISELCISLCLEELVHLVPLSIGLEEDHREAEQILTLVPL